MKADRTQLRPGLRRITSSPSPESPISEPATGKLTNRATVPRGTDGSGQGRCRGGRDAGRAATGSPIHAAAGCICLLDPSGATRGQLAKSCAEGLLGISTSEGQRQEVLEPTGKGPHGAQAE